MKIQFIDKNLGIVNEVHKHCSHFTNVKAIHASITWIETDAVVSPANSFGYMDGGIDLIYSLHFGFHIQSHLQNLIKQDYNGELPVGCAVVVPTQDPHGKIPWLVSAPTMREPTILPPDTINPYLSIKAALQAAAEHGKINTISFPGMGTGIGCVSGTTFAAQAAQAITELVNESII